MQPSRDRAANPRQPLRATITSPVGAHPSTSTGRIASILLPLGRAAAACLGLVVLLLGVAAAACSDDGPRSSPGVKFDSRGFEATLLLGAKPKPDLVLPDTSGRAFDLKTETDGFLTLFYVGYTHCPDICPLHMANIAYALKQMPADQAAKVKVVFVTADPDRDTATVLRSYLDGFNPSFIGLVPSGAQLTDLTASIGMNPITKEPLGNGSYSVSHAAYVLAFTANDNLAHVGFLGEMPRTVYVHDIPKLVAEGWKAP